MKHNNNFLVLFSIFIIVISCSNHTDSRAGVYLDNSKEIEKVLKEYNTKPSDSLKYKAAIFLLDNMLHHSYREPNKDYDYIFDKLVSYKDKKQRNYVFFKMLDSVKNLNEFSINPRMLDIETLDSDFVINNIELAFMAWYKIPVSKRASFDDFCNYILPYRSTNEPIEKGVRKKLFEKYSWVYPKLNNGTDLKFIVDSIKSQFDFTPNWQFGNYYKSPLSISQIEKAKIGVCDDGVNYLVNVFRAIGIVSAKDVTNQWGNNPSRGHSWLYTRYGEEEYATGPEINDKNLLIEFKGATIPKVNRIGYKYQAGLALSPYAIDVTNEYVETLDVNIKNEFNLYNSDPKLCVFNVDKGWNPVVSGVATGEDNFSFKNIGYNNVLYMAGTNGEDGMEAINYPFCINNQEEIHYFKPKDSIIPSVALTRKIGLTTYLRRFKLSWQKQVNRGFFEVANNPKFVNANVVHKITNYKGTHSKKILLNLKEKHEFIRFNSRGKHLPFLAELKFYDSNMKQIIPNVINESNIMKQQGYEVLDGNPLTFAGGKNFEIKLKFDKPEFIGAIEFQPRNDDNHINIGERYELFYWDRKWKTLGEQKATDTVLYYDIPENALLWLRNLTKGKEEHVFYIDSNKKQHWIGFDN